MLTFAAVIIRKILSVSFFKRDLSVRSTGEIISWWELRRLPYNLVVGASGIVTGIFCVIILLAGEFILKSPVAMPDPPLFIMFAVIAYGIMANICYTGGWVAELIARRVWEEKAEWFGEIAFSMGLAFSVLLTLLPVPGLIALEFLAYVLKPQ